MNTAAEGPAIRFPGCPPCKADKHEECEGLLLPEEVDFCECPICTARFNGNMRRIKKEIFGCP